MDPLVEHVAQALSREDPWKFQAGQVTLLAEVAVAAVRARPDLLGLRWQLARDTREAASSLGRRLVGEWEPAP